MVMTGLTFAGNILSWFFADKLQPFLDFQKYQFIIKYVAFIIILMKAGKIVLVSCAVKYFMGG